MTFHRGNAMGLDDLTNLQFAYLTLISLGTVYIAISLVRVATERRNEDRHRK